MVVDLQNDFCPGGALAVKEGDRIVAILNRYIKAFSKGKLPIFATRDWHPRVTKHFKQYGGPWPRHCVQNTKGAEFHPKLKLTKETVILSKGMNPDIDSYSAFQAFDSNGAELFYLLKLFGVNELFIAGLATDYCVKWSCLDALKYGFKVNLLIDAVKGVNVNKKDSDEAIEEMKKSGAKVIGFKKVSKII